MKRGCRLRELAVNLHPRRTPKKATAIVNVRRLIATAYYHLIVAVWKAKETEFGAYEASYRP
jgi:hypothetical protein